MCSCECFSVSVCECVCVFVSFSVCVGGVSKVRTQVDQGGAIFLSLCPSPSCLRPADL